MITAETITDAQISKLWGEACGTCVADVDPDTMHTCTVALNRSGDFTLAESEAARARCAKILNGRAHDLVKTGDADSHGEVVLAYCRVCRKGESELSASCPGAWTCGGCPKEGACPDPACSNGAVTAVAR